MPRRKTTKEFYVELQDLYEGEYSLKSEYLGARKPVKIEHIMCGQTFTTKPRNLISGKYECPSCKEIERKRLLNLSFENRVYELTNGEYRVVGEYTNNVTITTLYHEICGEEIDIYPYYFFKKPYCQVCSFKRKKTTAIFQAEVRTITNGKFDVIGQYINNQTNVWMISYKCGHKFPILPGNFLKRKRCPVCYGVAKRDTKTFKEAVFDVHGNEYEVLGEYVNKNSPIEVLHNVCKKKYFPTPEKMLMGRRCHHCYKWHKKTTEEFKEEVFETVGNEYEVVGTYEGARTPIEMKHQVCNNEYPVAPTDFLNGRRCPNCFGSEIKTLEEFTKEVYELVGDEYKVIGVYNGTNEKLKMHHTKCGFTYPIAPVKFLGGCRCPRCNESKGVQCIRKFLVQNNKNFEQEVSFDHCRHILPLPFDFAVYSESGKILHLIEFDGEFHFHTIGDWYTEEDLKGIQKRDRIKDEYCEEKGIHLIRIPYWEFANIDMILHNNGI